MSMIVVQKAKPTTVVRASRKQNVVSTTVVSLPTKKKKRRGKRKLQLQRGLGSGLSNDYFNCLVDPFQYPPVRAGFGCMVPTQVHTAFYRGQILAGSTDGAFALFAFPNPNNFIAITNGPYNNSPTTATSSLYAASNTVLLNSMYDSSRTLAMGVRIYPMIPSTSVPGILSLGCSPRAGSNDTVAGSATSPLQSGLINQNIYKVSQMPYLRQHIARTANADYYQATWRPTDIKDFEFQETDRPWFSIQTTQVTNSPFYDIDGNLGHGETNSRDTQGSFIVITGQGLPVNTSLYVEVVLHLETIDPTNPIATTDTSDSRASRDNIAAEGQFSSFESMYRSIMNILPSTDTVATHAATILASPMVQSAGKRYATNIIDRGLRSAVQDGFVRL
jgi:hypothetical protein